MTTFLQQVVNGLLVGSTYAVVALGFGLIFSVMRVLNIAHADLAMIGAYATYEIGNRVTSASASLSLLPAIGVFALVILGGMTAAGGCGLVIERLVLRPTRGAYLLIPFIATAGVAIFLENAVNTIYGSEPVPVRAVIPLHVFDLGGVRFSGMQLTTFITGILMLVALRYYVRRTKWGLATRAVAERSEVAAACGININGVSQLTIGIASALAGAAGVTIALLQTSASPFMGLTFGLKSFVCMLVAGNRHIEGIMAVGLVLGVLESLISGYLTSQLRDVIAYGILLAILMFRPSGLFGSYET